MATLVKSALTRFMATVDCVYVKRAFNFRRQCRAAVLSRCLHLARSHCRPLSLSISPL